MTRIDTLPAALPDIAGGGATVAAEPLVNPGIGITPIDRMLRRTHLSSEVRDQLAHSLAAAPCPNRHYQPDPGVLRQERRNDPQPVSAILRHRGRVRFRTIRLFC